MRGHEVAPGCFRDGTTELQRATVDAWWSRLRAAERRELSALADPRAESCSYSRTARSDGSSAWHGITIRLRGRFTEKERPSVEEAFPIDLYEHAVDRGIFLDDGLIVHVCTAHEAARAVVRAGFIPASFSCPLGRGTGCPMRRALDRSPGRSLLVQPRRVDPGSPD